MSKPEEKMIYRIRFQNKKHELTITAQTLKEVTFSEAISAAENDVLLSKPIESYYSNYLIEPICTEEEWSQGIVSFCPRCGKNIREYRMEKGGDFDCAECGAYVDAHILAIENEE